MTINTTTADTVTTTRAPDNGVFEFGCAGYCGGIECGFGEYLAGEPIIITIQNTICNINLVIYWML